jgi:hypothetical protein
MHRMWSGKCADCRPDPFRLQSVTIRHICHNTFTRHKRLYVGLFWCFCGIGETLALLNVEYLIMAQEKTLSDIFFSRVRVCRGVF